MAVFCKQIATGRVAAGWLLAGTVCALCSAVGRFGSPDRRRAARDTPDGEPCRSVVAATILGSYQEMPGLKLSVPQAARLFGLRPQTCEVVLADLAQDGALRRAPDGQYTGST
jgi:hypothetical protein